MLPLEQYSTPPTNENPNFYSAVIIHKYNICLLFVQISKLLENLQQFVVLTLSLYKYVPYPILSSLEMQFIVFFCDFIQNRIIFFSYQRSGQKEYTLPNIYKMFTTPVQVCQPLNKIYLNTMHGLQLIDRRKYSNEVISPILKDMSANISYNIKIEICKNDEHN